MGVEIVVEDRSCSVSGSRDGSSSTVMVVIVEVLIVIKDRSSSVCVEEDMVVNESSCSES